MNKKIWNCYLVVVKFNGAPLKLGYVWKSVLCVCMRLYTTVSIVYLCDSQTDRRILSGCSCVRNENLHLQIVYVPCACYHSFTKNSMNTNQLKFKRKILNKSKIHINEYRTNRIYLHYNTNNTEFQWISIHIHIVCILFDFQFIFFDFRLWRCLAFKLQIILLFSIQYCLSFTYEGQFIYLAMTSSLIFYFILFFWRKSCGYFERFCFSNRIPLENAYIRSGRK